MLALHRRSPSLSRQLATVLEGISKMNNQWLKNFSHEYDSTPVPNNTPVALAPMDGPATPAPNNRSAAASPEQETFAGLSVAALNLEDSNDLLDDQTTLTTPSSSDESLRSAKVNMRGGKLVPNDPTKLEGYRPMRVVMVQTALGLKPPSGGFRGNYATLFALSKHGHATMQFCWAHKHEIEATIAELEALQLLPEGGIDWSLTKIENEGRPPTEVTWWKFFNPHGVLCVALDADVMRVMYPNHIQQLDAAKWILTNEQPAQAKWYADWIVKHTKDFDPTHIIFNDAFASKATAEVREFKESVARVEVIHTLEQLPVGPFAGGVSGGSKTAAEYPLWEALDGVVAVSKAVERYTNAHCSLRTTMIPNHAWSYKDKETGDWPQKRSNFDKQNVVMINPANIKGYQIYLDMAKANAQRKFVNDLDPTINLPVYNFIAYSSWGSQPEMCSALETVGVKIYQPATDMEPVFDNMSILVVPSRWHEAWGLVATEAQIRGIPVIASDVGGLPEAKRYVPPLVRVNMIDGTQRNPDGTYVIPPQDAGPFMLELDRLLTDRDRYEAVADMGYYATREWLRKFDARAMEKLLLRIMK